jgi:uncharacterized protein with GYD domain
VATYISTISFTSQGMANSQDTCKRAAAFKAAARKMGGKVTAIYWTLGRFDGVVIFEADGDEAATALMLHLSSQGYVKTQTARAFTAPEMEKILAAAGKA